MDPMLEHADGSEMRISEMAVILMLLAAAPANGKVPNCSAETDFAVQLVDLGFERGLVVDHVTGG